MPAAGKVIVLEDNFDAVRNAVTGEMLMDAAEAGGFVVEGHAKIKAGSGRPGLIMRLGTLVNAIKTTRAKKSKTYAEVHIGPGSLIYARIHELGGIIRPVTAKMLSWVNDAGERIFAKLVHIPARPYLRPAMDENEESIVGAVKTELWRNITKAS